MRVLLLSDVNSAHTKRWATSLKQKGIDLAIFSISGASDNWTGDQGIRLLSRASYNPGIFSTTLLVKSTFLKLVPSLKRAIRQFTPDLIHAHYASSYG
ncbi:MAG: glycosyltransferase, partial [Bacteroidota bacterium]